MKRGRATAALALFVLAETVLGTPPVIAAQLVLRGRPTPLWLAVIAGPCMVLALWLVWRLPKELLEPTHRPTDQP